VKKSQVHLSVKQKFELIERLESGERMATVCTEIMIVRYKIQVQYNLTKKSVN
jgi:hypothetical protein